MDTFALSESLGTQLSNFSLTGTQMPENKFDSPGNDRKITGKGQYGDPDEYYYDNIEYAEDQFEVY